MGSSALSELAIPGRDHHLLNTFVSQSPIWALSVLYAQSLCQFWEVGIITHLEVLKNKVKWRYEMLPSHTICGCLEVTGTRAPWEHWNHFVHWYSPSIRSIFTCSSLSRNTCWMLTKWIKRGGIWAIAILNLKLFLPGRNQFLQSFTVRFAPERWTWSVFDVFFLIFICTLI